MVFIHTKMYTDEVFNDKHHSLDFSQIYTNKAVSQGESDLFRCTNKKEKYLVIAADSFLHSNIKPIHCKQYEKTGLINI